MNNVLKKVLFLLLISLTCGMGYAQKIKKVSATITYVIPETQSTGEAKGIAIQRARLKAIADKFGTTMEQTNLTRIKTQAGESNMEFNSYNESQVNGEWIENTDEPICKEDMIDGQHVIICTVKGRARERKSSAITLEAKILRNGTEKRFESENFKHGDQLFLAFKSPADGYIAVYLIDPSKDASCLLPYPTDSDGKTEVKHGQEYIFFSEAHEIKSPQPYDFIKSSSIVQEYDLACIESDNEINQIYIIYSPNPFTKAVDTVEGGIGHLSEDEFHKWLGHIRTQDPDMVVEKRNIYVNK